MTSEFDKESKISQKTILPKLCKGSSHNITDQEDFSTQIVSTRRTLKNQKYATEKMNSENMELISQRDFLP